jgi:hypothetical protein
MVVVDWVRLGQATEYWQGMGFRLVDAPWIVSAHAARTTFPTYRPTRGEALVGSGEQSLIQMQASGELSRLEGQYPRGFGGDVGQWCTCTPCFRDDTPDRLHRTEFMKVELFSTNPGHLYDAGLSLAKRALGFFNILVDEAKTDQPYAEQPKRSRPQLVKTPEGYDIMLNGVEIGSYGMRQATPYTKTPWVYGTGLAEPRFGIALGTAMDLSMSNSEPISLSNSR